MRSSPSRAKISCLLVTVILLAWGAGCGRSAGTSSNAAMVTISITPQPVSIGSSTLDLTVKDPTGNPVEGAKLTVEGDMNHAGMAPVYGRANDEGGGHYQVTGFNFDMAGDWVLTVTGKLANGKKLSHQFDVNGVRP